MLKSQKHALVRGLSDALPQASGFVLCSYQGLNMAGFMKLRSEMFKLGVTTRVVKNRLMQKALESAQFTSMNDVLKGTTMVVYTAQDVLAPLHKLSEFARKEELFKIKAACVDKEVCTPQQLAELSLIPSFQGLMAMTLGALDNILASFNGTLEALEQKKGS